MILKQSSGSVSILGSAHATYELYSVDRMSQPSTLGTATEIKLKYYMKTGRILPEHFWDYWVKWTYAMRQFEDGHDSTTTSPSDRIQRMDARRSHRYSQRGLNTQMIMTFIR